MDWKFWLMFFIAALSLLNTLFSPLVMWAIKTILDRLKDGDKKFDQLGQDFARMDQRFDNFEKQYDETKRAVDKEKDRRQEMGLEGAASMSEMKVVIEREFVRKSEFSKLVDLVEARHMELITAIHQLERAAQ